MAVETKGSRKPSNRGSKTGEQERAPAWINLSVTGKAGPNGEPGRQLQVGGIPLTLTKALHKEIMDKGQGLLNDLIKNGRVTLTLQIVEEHQEGDSFF